MATTDEVVGFDKQANLETETESVMEVVQCGTSLTSCSGHRHIEESLYYRAKQFQHSC